MLGNRSEDPRSLETIAKHGTGSRYYDPRLALAGEIWGREPNHMFPDK